MYLVTKANGVVVMLDDYPCETCIKRSEGIAPVSSLRASRLARVHRPPHDDQCTDDYATCDCHEREWARAQAELRSGDGGESLHRVPGVADRGPDGVWYQCPVCGVSFQVASDRSGRIYCGPICKKAAAK